MNSSRSCLVPSDPFHVTVSSCPWPAAVPWILENKAEGIFYPRVNLPDFERTVCSGEVLNDLKQGSLSIN